MSKLKIGKKVPDFQIASTGNKTIRLSELKGNKVVLYFYPRDNTPGCTREGRDFRDNIRKFRARKTKVFGISRDSLESHRKFRDQECFPFDLLSDEDEKLCRMFDVIRENVREKGHGDRAQHFSYRQGRRSPQGVAQGKSRRAHR